MGEGLIVRRGGGGGASSFAFIVATYPSGSTCTCTNGTKTITAKNTSGSFVFHIPSAGTWTVSCTNGTNTKSQSVSITAEGQSVSVTLTYRIYFYNRGDIANSGGWGSNATSRTTFNADHIYIKGTGSGETFIHSQVPVPLGYTKMYIVGEVLDEVNDICFEKSGLANNSDWSLTVAWSNGTVGAFTRVVDISGVTTLSGRYVKIGVGWGVNCKGNIYEVYFE